MDTGPIIGSQVPQILPSYATASLQNIQQEQTTASQGLPHSYPPPRPPPLSTARYHPPIVPTQPPSFYSTTYFPEAILRPTPQSSTHAAAGVTPHQLQADQYGTAQTQALNLALQSRDFHAGGQDRGLIREQESEPRRGFPEETSQGKSAEVKPKENPPNLEQWREKLFEVEEMIVLTEHEYMTYWPHVDNVYSHRSTQRYKRNPFIAHYWDCRLKGRPSGTKKSEDPTKKKRKRIARERDLCEVKIKVTEYFPGTVNQHGHAVTNQDNVDIANPQNFAASHYFNPGQLSDPDLQHHTESEGRLQLPLVSAGGASVPLASGSGSRIFTIQRVNGNVGTGKSEIPPQRHRHTLGFSDEIKKNSVVRQMMKDHKHRKKQEKSYHTKATGNALQTVKRHSKESQIKLFGSCFCPFVQRVWISLEHKQIPYQYIEIDPYEKPRELLDINPRGLVPALKDGDWGCYESTVLMEYLEDLKQGQPILPADPKARAYSRLWSDHCNRNIIPTFYRYLQAQDQDKQIAEAKHLQEQIRLLVQAADSDGPYFLGANSSFVDFQVAPWVIRLKRVLSPYRGWPAPEAGSRWERWVNAIENDKDVMATTSDDKLYMDSYLRYAENRPNTSQLARAINEGRGLP